MRIVLIFISAILVNNFVLSKFLGICPFLGVSKKIDSAVGMSMAVIFVMTMAGIITWFLNLLLVSMGLEFLRLIVFILVIAVLVQFVEFFIKKTSPSLYEALGIFLPLITTNCAVLGVALINVQTNYNFIEAFVNSLASALGFAMALIIFSAIREKLDLNDIPAPFKGTAVALITAGLLSMAFMGFSGLVKL
ncbi:electron transport complex subunit RsxA [Oceanotoga sp. DSM 15011]|jgi:electron transport complex protein RnfA|uniref:Ion-translocating oxidoreductase complex subunit A n=1 Tax=Oceanotoga teriensis TaxID=515440 RepID=A0AA45C9G4_9BACT|nr:MULTISPECIES: electron transport complex subunit RsxA [Oceanotoga]MDN5342917.1 H+/Na+-translocating ferredoxin:NAD+ oxidoreductase subunit [Oceanotoga sp.]MDO7975365.1 electron transport complex subunit RsxA [Oceanotoga teriensis]PWJ96697.1 electron transport complex protein RnfA [Oceanotoga teriensis]UYP00131.1 electron transport complex subunit RsxA [Oceanotoga sp. DSM 15011]